MPTKVPESIPEYIRTAQQTARWMQQCRLNQTQAARALGKSQSALANQLRLLRLPTAVQQSLALHRLSQRHARALLRLPTQAQQLAAIETIVRHGLNVAQTEVYIDTLQAAPHSPALCRFLSELRHLLTRLHTAGIPVKLTHTRSGTALKITIEIDAGKG